MPRPKNRTVIPSSVVHTVPGMIKTQDTLIKCFNERYNGLRYAMFEWSDDSGKSDDMFLISCGEAPEKLIINSPYVAGFDFEGNTYMLPIVESFTPNIYGKPLEWRVQSYGNDLITKEINKIPMNWENSCLCQDCLTPTQDINFIDAMIMHMVDAMTTLHGRTLLARAPYLIYMEGLQDSKATSYMNAIASGSPFIAQDRSAMIKPELLQAPVVIDTGLMDIISFYDAQILSFLGYDATDTYKRAQQSVPEVNMSQSKISIRRKEKLYCRKSFCDRYNKKFGNQFNVISVLDEQPELINDIQPVGDYLNDRLGKSGVIESD